MRALAGFAALVVVMTASVAAAVAAEPTDLRDCPLRVAEPAQTVTADVGEGWSAALRIPGRLQTPAGAIQWTVRMSGGRGAPPVAGAQFVVDGRVAHEPRRLRSWGVRLPSYVWYVYTSRFRPGRHALEVRVRLASGGIRVLVGSFIASRCPTARFWASTVVSTINFDSTYGEGIGPRIASATVRALPGARFVLPRARPGTVVGKVSVYRPGGRYPEYSLRAPRDGRTLLARRGLRVVLDVRRQRLVVSGLPPRSQGAHLRFDRRVLRPSRPCAQGRMEAVLRALDGRGVRLVGRTRTCRPVH